jgi:uncharacterized membrane protein
MSKASAKAPADLSAATSKPARLASVDFLRGLVIVIMALDHVRDYTSNIRFDPLDPEQTNAALYLTRWITNYCAPAFVFLAGAGAGFQRHAGKTPAQLSIFLLTRGLWLIFLEVTVILIGWKFNFSPLVFLQVIWAIGISMVALAALVRLPLWAIFAVAAVMVLGHNLFDGVRVPFDFQHPTSEPSHILWALLHQSTPLQIGPFFVFVAYPVVPWIGVMALGYCFAEAYRLPEPERRKLLMRIGLCVIGAFLVLRAVNLYGDPQPWKLLDTTLKTAMTFFNTAKYPPSLQFLLMTLGPAILLLAFAEKWKGRVFDFITVFGRVPLFFYVLHIYLAHLFAVGLGVAQGFPATAMTQFVFSFPPNYGVDLPWVYFAWIALVVTLYPACVWFGGVKRRSKHWVLSYF